MSVTVSALKILQPVPHLGKDALPGSTQKQPAGEVIEIGGGLDGDGHTACTMVDKSSGLQSNVSEYQQKNASASVFGL